MLSTGPTICFSLMHSKKFGKVFILPKISDPYIKPHSTVRPCMKTSLNLDKRLVNAELCVLFWLLECVFIKIELTSRKAINVEL